MFLSPNNFVFLFIVNKESLKHRGYTVTEDALRTCEAPDRKKTKQKTLTVDLSRQIDA